MKKLIQKQNKEEFINFPITNIRKGWFFRVDEISQGYYRVEGVDRFGRVVSKEGIDPELLLEECKNYIQEVEETG